MQQTWALCTWAQIITKKEKKKKEKRLTQTHHSEDSDPFCSRRDSC